MELVLLGDTLVGLACALDAILLVAVFRRQQLHDLEAGVLSDAAQEVRFVSDALADFELVHFQIHGASLLAAKCESRRRHRQGAGVTIFGHFDV